jgi:hypothetical protein
LKILCEFWGLDGKKFSLYDENGEPLELETIGGANPPMNKIMETVMVKE